MQSTPRKHTSRKAMLTKMAYFRRNGKYVFVEDTTDKTAIQNMIDTEIKYNTERIRLYQKACILGDMKGILFGQAWLEGLWNKQGLNPARELVDMKRLLGKEKGKLKF